MAGLTPEGSAGPSARERDDQPTLLVVGSGESMDVALREALERHQLFVDQTETSAAAAGVFAAAPDLVLLVGDATADGGARVLAELARSPATSVVPVAILAREGELGDKLRAFRAGAAAVIERGPSVDAIARQVAELVRRLGESPERAGALGEATLDELVRLLSQELRSGILSVHGAKGAADTEGLRLVLGAGRPVAEAVEAFVQRLRSLVSEAEPVKYEFEESTIARLQLLETEDAADAASLDVLQDLRVLLILSDPERSELLERELRAKGAIAVPVDTRPAGLLAAGALDPAVAIVDRETIEASPVDVLRLLRADRRLRWAAAIVLNWDELVPEPGSAPHLRRLARRIAPLVEHERSLVERAQREDRFDTRLEVTGPFRALRGLSRVERPLRVSVRQQNRVVELDLAGGLLVGALARRPAPQPPIEGVAAVASFLSMTSGRVSIEHRPAAASANLVMPIDQAIDAASAQSASVTSPAIAPPRRTSSPSMPAVTRAPSRPAAPVVVAPALPDDLSDPDEWSRVAAPEAATDVATDSRTWTAAVRAVTPPVEIATAPAPAPLPAPVVQTAPPPEAEPEPEPGSGIQPPGAPGAGIGPGSPELLGSGILPPGAPGAGPGPGSPEPEPEPEPTGLDELDAPVDLAQLRMGSPRARVAIAAGSLVGAAVLAFVLVRAPWSSGHEPPPLAESDAPRASAQPRATLASNTTGPSGSLAVGPAVATPPAPAPPAPQPAPAPPPLAPPEPPPAAPGPAPTPEASATPAPAGEPVAATDDGPDASLDQARAFVTRATKLRASGSLGEAERQYLAALRVEPLYVPAADGLARLHLARHDSRSALLWARKAVKLRPGAAGLHLLLGDALAQSGDRNGAQAEWRRALSMNPRLREAQRRLAPAPAKRR